MLQGNKPTIQSHGGLVQDQACKAGMLQRQGCYYAIAPSEREVQGMDLMEGR